MAISSFSGSTGGASGFNDFVVDMNDTSNNVIDLGRPYAAGAYEISLATGASSFDIYAIDVDGNLVGYSNDATLVVTAAFTQLAILGVSQTERLTFAFSGASNDATAEGIATGAGAYLEDATPSDLPNQDDTTTVTGGNFASDVQIFFESGATSTAAKNITRNDSTELIVTRPDALDASLDPWSLRAVNPGIPEPTGSDANILADVIDAGALPVWVTDRVLSVAPLNSSYSETLEATDAEGAVTYAVTSGTLPTGLSLDSSTGEISGTPTSGSETFTVTATDEGGNAKSKEFDLLVALASGGTIEPINGFITHTFTSSDDFVVQEEISAAEYLVVAGGGGGSQGGGGAGGYLSSIAGETGAGGDPIDSTLTLSAGTYAVGVGSGGAATNTTSNSIASGGNSFITGFVTADGGGGGATSNTNAGNGGSGGGSGHPNNGGSAGSGIAGQGFAGGQAPSNSNNSRGAGGGALQAGGNSINTTPGISSSVTGTAVEFSQGGGGSGSDPGETADTPGSGGGCSKRISQNNASSGENGLVVIRYQ